MANSQPKLNRHPNTGKWTARYWVQVEMSPTHTCVLDTRYQTVPEVTANLLEALAPLEPHWKVLYMRGNTVSKVRYPIDGYKLIKEEDL